MASFHLASADVGAICSALFHFSVGVVLQLIALQRHVHLPCAAAEGIEDRGLRSAVHWAVDIGLWVVSEPSSLPPSPRGAAPSPSQRGGAAASSQGGAASSSNQGGAAPVSSQDDQRRLRGAMPLALWDWHAWWSKWDTQARPDHCNSGAWAPPGQMRCQRLCECDGYGIECVSARAAAAGADKRVHSPGMVAGQLSHLAGQRSAAADRRRGEQT